MGKIKNEEFSALGDFIKTSFERDYQQIMVRYPKLNGEFLKEYTDKLSEIKTLENSIVMTEAQKSTTASLYAEADALDHELGFLMDYLKAVGLDAKPATSLKKDLNNRNIEGATLKAETLAQFITAHQQALTEQGMPSDFATTLEAHRVSLAAKNKEQNSAMNARKALTNANNAKYTALYEDILKITNAGKKVFAGTVTMEEYNIKTNLGRMRAAKRLPKE